MPDRAAGTGEGPTSAKKPRQPVVVRGLAMGVVTVVMLRFLGASPEQLGGGWGGRSGGLAVEASSALLPVAIVVY